MKEFIVDFVYAIINRVSGQSVKNVKYVFIIIFLRLYFSRFVQFQTRSGIIIYICETVLYDVPVVASAMSEYVLWVHGTLNQIHIVVLCSVSLVIIELFRILFGFLFLLRAHFVFLFFFFRCMRAAAAAATIATAHHLCGGWTRTPMYTRSNLFQIDTYTQWNTTTADHCLLYSKLWLLYRCVLCVRTSYVLRACVFFFSIKLLCGFNSILYTVLVVLDDDEPHGSFILFFVLLF